MTNQEIKLRLVEAFIKDGIIRQGHNFDYITGEIDKLLDYVKKNDELQEKIDTFFENHFKDNKDCKSESISKRIDREKVHKEMLKIYNETMDSAISYVENNNKVINRNSEIAKEELSEEEKLRKIYFDFYDKMEEPERSEAMENWNYEYCSNIIPETVHGAIILGFNWCQSKQVYDYWKNIYNNTHK